MATVHEMISLPPEKAIAQVMADTKMDYVQAHRHLQQRAQLVLDAQRKSPAYSTSESAYYMTQQRKK